MKRKKQNYQLEIPDDDYKLQWLMTEDKKNFESVDKWLYIGADKINSRFAKIGITTGNLQSRSYSSTNPNYYLFCAFKCKHNISKVDLERVESSILSFLDDRYVNENGETKRASHAESGVLSECFYDIDFDEMLYDIHYYIYNNHNRYFSYGGLVDDYDNDCGDILDIEFNRAIVSQDRITKCMHFLAIHR
ncbi:hypothetical protein ABN115_13375 [Providencia rettgeri]|uniref:hypothetical protein n=1 Tax=Providencia TaxID=586 RepID=UPI001BD14C3D|nr:MULTISPECIES: hypothetical protein [Providencia]